MKNNIIIGKNPSIVIKGNYVILEGVYPYRAFTNIEDLRVVPNYYFIFYRIMFRTVGRSKKKNIEKLIYDD